MDNWEIEEMKTKTIKLSNGMEITEPIKVSSYKEAEDKCPKGFRIPMMWELVKMMQETDYLLNYQKGESRFFISKKNENNIVRGLFLYCGGGWSALWYSLANSLDYGLVVYLKVEK